MKILFFLSNARKMNFILFINCKKKYLSEFIYYYKEVRVSKRKRESSYMPFFHLHLVQQIIMNKPFGVDMCVCVPNDNSVYFLSISIQQQQKKIVACHLSFSSPVVL
jgi:hypothetical protein